MGLCGLLELIGYFGNWICWREAKLEEKALQEAKAPALRLAAGMLKSLENNFLNNDLQVSNASRAKRGNGQLRLSR